MKNKNDTNAEREGVANDALFGVWNLIETAPKDEIILVNDTTGNTPWAAAKWVESDEWSGWIYDDDISADSNPTGPEPTHWFSVPPLPNAEPIHGEKDA